MLGSMWVSFNGAVSPVSDWLSPRIGFVLLNDRESAAVTSDRGVACESEVVDTGVPAVRFSSTSFAAGASVFLLEASADVDMEAGSSTLIVLLTFPRSSVSACLQI